MTARSILYTGLALSAVSCAAPEKTTPAQACPDGGILMTKTELYFGLTIPGGGKVSDAQWSAFLEANVTPRFPEGLTVDETAGQWRDVATGKTVREPSRSVMLLYRASAEAESAIQAIRAAYKSRFQQDSVMRLDETSCVAF